MFLAPNGKKSNLTPEQYKLVRTPEFKTWFGDWENDPLNASKVVDENGEPLVVYRGMPKKRKVGNIFRTNVNLFGSTGVGGRATNYFAFYFTDIKEVAEAYGKNLTEEEEDYIVKSYFLNVRNLFDAFKYKNQYEIDFKTLYDLANKTGEKIYLRNYRGDLEYGWNIEKRKDEPKEYYQYNNSFEHKYKYLGQVPNTEPTYSFFVDWNKKYDSNQFFWRNYLQQNLKYDGLVFYEITHNISWNSDYTQSSPMYGDEFSKTYGVFEPNNIKLADGSNTTFDANNPDIRFDDGGDVGQEIKCRRCGWNWNTKDSEEYEKYVCHNCGFDNRTFYDVDPIGYADGGNVKSFYDWYTDWYKRNKNEITLMISLPNELRPFKEDNVVIFDKFEKSNKSVKAYKYLQQIIDKADEYGVTIYLEPTPIGNVKTKSELIDYFKKFGFELTPNNKFMKRLPKYKDGGKIKSIVEDSKETGFLKFRKNAQFIQKHPELFLADGGEVDDKKKIYAKWKSLVNMSYGKIKKFYDSKEGKDAGLSSSEASKQGISSGRESARMLMKMKTTPKDKWTDEMWKWANKQISFISRMSGMQGELYDDNGNKTRKHTSLLIWGHNPKKNTSMKYEDGGVADVRMEDTVQRMDNPNFADISYYDNGGATDFGKVITSSSRFKPRETIVFDPPLIGTNGNKLISYTWSYEWTEDFNKFKGETVSKRISDWTQAETNAETGRQIVHQYGIQLADGSYKTVSSETVPIILGFIDKKQSSTLPNLVTASKTLAKQKMQLAILEAKKIEEENAIKEIMSKPFPPITKSIAFGDSIRYTMGKVSVIDHNIDIDSEISKERKEVLIDGYVREQLKEIGINANDYYKTYELKNRIQRQERKIQNILENKMEDGGELEGLTQSEIDTNVHNIARKFKMPLEYINSQLKLGIKFEMEHTDDKSIASKIALDHLNESPYYYQKLTEMEKELDTMKMDADSYLPKVMSAYANGGEVDMIFKLNTPTKQPTKLNYIQQVLVRTTEFKKWFGDWEKCAESFLQDKKNNFLTHYKNCSIVIDLTTLEPQVVYHGTNFKEEFYTFDVTKKEGVGRPYGYFADNIEYSQNFTTNSQRGQHGLELMYKCFLNIRKPFMAIGNDFYNEKKDEVGWSLIIAKQIAIDKYGEANLIEKINDVLKVVMEQTFPYLLATFEGINKPFWLLMARDTKKEFKYFLMSHGYDGVRYAEEFKGVYDVDNPAEFTKAWTIFDANQVKLADGRNINFDPFKEDIRYKEGGSLTELNQEDMQQDNMSKAQMLRNTIGVNKFAEGGTVKGDGKHTNDAKKGGFFDGRSHAEGGIKAVNKDTGQLLEVEGNEVIINKRSVADDTKREFEGKMMTNREILSTINEMGGGVSFKEGGEINEKSCKCMGKKYKFGGNLISDYDIVKELTTSYNDVIKKPISDSINYVENLINKINGNY